MPSTSGADVAEEIPQRPVSRNSKAPSSRSAISPSTKEYSSLLSGPIASDLKVAEAPLPTTPGQPLTTPKYVSFLVDLTAYLLESTSKCISDAANTAASIHVAIADSAKVSHHIIFKFRPLGTQNRATVGTVHLPVSPRIVFWKT